MIFRRCDNMMHLKSDTTTTTFMVAVAAILASVFVAFSDDFCKNLIFSSISDTVSTAAPVAVLGTTLDTVWVLIFGFTLIPSNLTFLGLQPSLPVLRIVGLKLMNVGEIVERFMTFLKTHSFNRRMVGFAETLVPSRFTLSAVRMMSSFVLRIFETFTFLSVNRKRVKCFFATALACLFFFNSLCFGYTHDNLLSVHYTGKLEGYNGKERELLESPKSHNRYNVTGNGERDSLKSVVDWVISSQAAEGSVEGSTTRSWSPERTVKTHERAPLTGLYSLVSCESMRSGVIKKTAITQRPYTGKLDNLSKHPVKEIIRKVLKNDASKAFDIAARAQFDAAKLTVAPTSGTSTTAVTLETTGTCTVTNDVAMGKDHVKAVVDLMKERNIPTFSAGDYFCIGRPTTFRTVKNDLEGIHQYVDAGFRLIMNGEIGRYEGVRFIEQTNIGAQAWTNAKSDVAHFFGEDTVAEAIVCPEEIRGKIPGDYGRSRGIAWYYQGGFGLVHTDIVNARIVRWESAA